MADCTDVKKISIEECFGEWNNSIPSDDSLKSRGVDNTAIQIAMSVFTCVLLLTMLATYCYWWRQRRIINEHLAKQEAAQFGHDFKGRPKPPTKKTSPKGRQMAAATSASPPPTKAGGKRKVRSIHYSPKGTAKRKRRPAKQYVVRSESRSSEEDDSERTPEPPGADWHWHPYSAVYPVQGRLGLHVEAGAAIPALPPRPVLIASPFAEDHLA